MPAVAEWLGLALAYPALLERACVGLIPANSDAQHVPSFCSWRFEMKVSPFFCFAESAIGAEVAVPWPVQVIGPKGGVARNGIERLISWLQVTQVNQVCHCVLVNFFLFMVYDLRFSARYSSLLEGHRISEGHRFEPCREHLQLFF